MNRVERGSAKGPAVLDRSLTFWGGDYAGKTDIPDNAA
jgi:hypothetical protein